MLDKYVMLCFLFLALMVGVNWLVIRIRKEQCHELDHILLLVWLGGWVGVNLIMLCVVLLKVNRYSAVSGSATFIIKHYC